MVRRRRIAVTDPLVPIGDGHTELSEEDRLGLIPTYIATRGELFDAEQRNIAEALLRRRPSLQQLLDDKYLRDLHQAMFGRVWEWAGRYRRTKTNIGIDPTRIEYSHGGCRRGLRRLAAALAPPHGGASEHHCDWPGS